MYIYTCIYVCVKNYMITLNTNVIVAHFDIHICIRVSIDISCRTFNSRYRSFICYVRSRESCVFSRRCQGYVLGTAVYHRVR